jgi:hypothetical protein
MLRYKWLKFLSVLILFFIWAHSSLAQSGLGDAIGTARIDVIVTDTPGGQPVNGAFVNIVHMSGTVQCTICSGTTENNLPLQFTLTGVSVTGDEIVIEVSGVPDFDPVTETVTIVAFSTVSIEIALRDAQLLQVQVAGEGKGFVTSSPVGIDCGTHADETLGENCTTGYSIGTLVTLIASPVGNSIFTGWSGGTCSGNNLCIVEMTQAQTVTATFTSECDDFNYSIYPMNYQFTASGGAGSIEVVASTGCAWNAFESSGWIAITAGSSGIGVGTVNYTVSSNTGSSSRTATITVAGISHTVSQDPIVAIEVDIDIRPWSKSNPIYYNGFGIIPVAILSTVDLNASSEIDQNSLTFGATGGETSFAFCMLRPIDVSKDGSRDDLLCYFYINKAGFKCGEKKGILMGKTVSGIPLKGEDLVRIIHCR